MLEAVELVLSLFAVRPRPQQEQGVGLALGDGRRDLVVERVRRVRHRSILAGQQTAANRSSTSCQLTMFHSASTKSARTLKYCR